jgi:hypothetical protein
MAEPASSTAAGVAIAAGTITLTGSILGVHYDALLAGFAGGLVWLTFQPAVSVVRIAGSIVASSLIAGFVAPIVAAGAVNYLQWLAALGDHMRIASAFGLGVGAQVIVPLGLNKLRLWGGAQ